MDPLTITGAIAGIKMANSAFGVIKQAIQNGREVTDCASALSKWVAGCNAVQKEHSQKTSRLGGSASERAVEKLEREYRLQAKKERDDVEKKQKKKRDIIIAGLIVLFIAGVFSFIGFMLYLVITEGNV